MSTLYSNDFLEPITSEVKRKKFCTVDIESKHDDTQDKGFTRPFLIGTYDPLRRNYRDFSNDVAVVHKPWEERAAAGGGCVDQVMNYLLSHHFKDYVIYAHFGGSFDHLFWLSWLKKHNDEYGFEIMPVQSSIQAIKVWRRPEDPEAPITERWEFLDSFKLFPMGLDKLCQTFGLRGKVEQDLDVHEDDPSWRVYLKQDCIALADGLTKIHDLIEQRLGGEVGMTTPSTSMKLFRRKYLGKGGTPKRLPRYTHWPDCKNKEECTGCAEEWIRKGYFGGRTEMFETFGERLHYYDINSSYVAAMREEMPVGNRMVTTTLDWRMADKHVGFVECSVDIPEDCVLPPLPFRAQTGKLIFPTGKFTGIWSTNELKLLSDPLVKGSITAVKKVVWFGLRPVFNEMVDELWKLRDKTLPGYDEGLSALGKLLGNSLYGKFGMRRERTSIVVKRDVDNQHCFLCQEPVEDEKKGGLCKACQGSKPASNATSTVWYQAKETDADYIMPHISSHITALARVRLWGFMKDAIVAGGRVLYCDTDSIITDAIIPSTTALGGMKDEYPLPFAKSASECFAFDTLDNLETWLEGHLLKGTFVQAKVYMIETGALDGRGEPTKAKVTMKGFPRHLRTKENLARLQEGAVLEYQNLEKVRTLAAIGLLRGPRMKTVKKSFRGTYDKRVLNGDGLTTKAVVLDEPNFVEAVDERNPGQGEGSEPLSGKGLASEGLGSDVVGKILDGLLSNVDRLMGCVRGARDEAGLAF